MTSAFERWCKLRGVDPDQWLEFLKAPIVQKKCLIDCTDEELEAHYMEVEERAAATQVDRALAILKDHEGASVERAAYKVFAKHSRVTERLVGGEVEEIDGIRSFQVEEMLQELGFDIGDTELHWLLHKIGATDGFDMLPEVALDEWWWLWMVGEAVRLRKMFSLYLNREVFEITYESKIEQELRQKEAGLKGTDEWPHVTPTGDEWYLSGGEMPGYKGPYKAHVWGGAPEEVKEETTPDNMLHYYEAYGGNEESNDESELSGEEVD